ncbi:hypothetical protein PAPYR_4974 [Paratrimastix pyriformis]|uniref:non-specific serine/threonine protein kinase n=1 Tax=Paratrimastix pyriformis TaxID=342808 RepID=A0ABQ8UNT5_9EUKA|nr:hypothetical protein PAPYR_4974 [Paratrimastix pyriformis]
MVEPPSARSQHSGTFALLNPTSGGGDEPAWSFRGRLANFSLECFISDPKNLIWAAFDTRFTCLSLASTPEGPNGMKTIMILGTRSELLASVVHITQNGTMLLLTRPTWLEPLVIDGTVDTTQVVRSVDVQLLGDRVILVNAWVDGVDGPRASCLVCPVTQEGIGICPPRRYPQATTLVPQPAASLIISPFPILQVDASSTLALLSVTPSASPQNQTARLAIQGTGFQPAAVVTLGGIRPCTGVAVSGNGTAITCTFEAASDADAAVIAAAASGPLAVAVANPDGARVEVVGLFYWQAPPPALLSLWPLEGSLDGALAVRLTGTNIRPGATVLLDGLPCNCTLTSPCVSCEGLSVCNCTVFNVTALSCVIPAARQEVRDRLDHHQPRVAVDLVLINRDMTAAAMPGAFCYTGGLLSLVGVIAISACCTGLLVGLVVTMLIVSLRARPEARDDRVDPGFRSWVKPKEMALLAVKVTRESGLGEQRASRRGGAAVFMDFQNSLPAPLPSLFSFGPKDIQTFLESGGQLNLLPNINGRYQHIANPFLGTPFWLLGAGMLGYSFRCVDTGGGDTLVVVKVLRAFQGQPEFDQAILSGFYWWHGLTNPPKPHIAPASGAPFAAQVEPNGPQCVCMVSPFCEGGDLDGVIRRGDANTPEERWRIAKGLFIGLGYLHTKPLPWSPCPLLHNNIKPPNVLMRRNPADHWRLEPLLADFTRAVELSPGGDGHLAGTPGFAAPELLQQAPNHLSADVYALGCTLYCLYAGVDSTRLVEVPPPESLREVFAELPATVRELVVAMCAQSPGDRPTMSAILAAVAGV